MVEMKLSTKDILSALYGAELSGPDRTITYRGVSTDTRGDCRGTLFVALTGERFDGNAFLEEAEKAGILGAVIGPTAAGYPVPSSLQCFRVADTLEALQRLAAWKRNLQSDLRVVALTGSNGKTTTKEMIAAILSRKFKTQATAGNLNNHVGVPLTLLGLEPQTEFLVTEIGANHPGEVRSLARLVKPEISVITNVAAVHLEGFGNIEGVLKAKLELFEETKKNGWYIYNGDNTYLRSAVPKVFPRTFSFGLGANNDLTAAEISLDKMARPSFLVGGTKISLGTPGRHNVLNALAAAAVGRITGVTDEEIKEGLEKVKPLKMRMELKTVGKVLILNDTYNANPLSMREALLTLKTIEHDGPHVAVLGEMLELGAESEKLHAELARFASELKLDLVVMVGSFAGIMSEIYISAGGNGKTVFACPDAISAWEVLRKKLSGGELILVKGSRGVHLEHLVGKMEKSSA